MRENDVTLGIPKTSYKGPATDTDQRFHLIHLWNLHFHHQRFCEPEKKNKGLSVCSSYLPFYFNMFHIDKSCQKVIAGEFTSSVLHINLGTSKGNGEFSFMFSSHQAFKKIVKNLLMLASLLLHFHDIKFMKL